MWTTVQDHLPEANQMVEVKTTVRKGYRQKKDTVRFVKSTDGDYFWDNLFDNVWQSHEVTHWRPACP